MSGTFTGIIDTMFRKLNGETMKGTFMQAGDESFHHLPCKKFQTAEASDLV
jgi:hypothetical protein